MSLCLFVPFSPSPSLSVSIHLVSSAQEILTDPLEELRDSISRRQNSTVVPGNSGSLRKMSAERGVMIGQEEKVGGGGKGHGKRRKEGT